MKKIITITTVFLLLISNVVFAQFKVEDITDSLHTEILETFEDERITDFLEIFAADLKDYSWEKVRRHFYDKHYEFEIHLMTDEGYNYTGSQDPDSLNLEYLGNSIGMPYYKWKQFSDEFMSTSKIKDFTKIDDVYYIKKKRERNSDDDIESYWEIEFILKTTDGQHYMGRIYLLVQKADGKVFAFNSYG